MAKKGNPGVLEILQKGPGTWGVTQEEREACTLAEQWLLEAKEPIEYREKLLKALLNFKYKEGNEDGHEDAWGCN